MLFKISAHEDRPTPPEVYNWRLYTEASIIATGSLLFGYDSAFIGTTIARSSFQSAFHITAANSAAVSSNVTSVFQAGAFFGALFCLPITELVGRRGALQLSNVVFLVGAVLLTAASHNLAYIYAGRILTGLGCGGITATVPSYIAELSIPPIRGILTGLFECAYQVGSLVGFWINYGITQNMDVTHTVTWRLPMAVQIVPSGLLLLGCLLLHESPLWLLRRGRDDAACTALEALRRLPADHPYVQQDLAAMQGRLHEEAAMAARYAPDGATATPWATFRGAVAELARRRMNRRLLLIFCMFAFQNLSGAAAINYYSPTLFASIGISDVTLYTGIYGLVKAVASLIFYFFFVDSVGRRRPVLVSSVACSLCLWYVGAYVKIGHPADIIAAGHTLSPSTKSGGDGATAMIMLYAVFWSFGLNGIPWIVSAEIFPGALRNYSGTWAAMVQWATQFPISKCLPYIFSSFGYGTWFFFASILMSSAVWAFFMLPETKGLTMEQMDEIWTDDAGFRGIPHTSITTNYAITESNKAAAKHVEQV